MENKEIFEMANEAYQQGFQDGFEYGSGKKSPYAQGGCTSDCAPSVSNGTLVQVHIPSNNVVDAKDIVDQINKQMRKSPRA